MVGYRATEIRTPSNESEFEKNCVVLFSELINDPTGTRVGTKGQKQHGLDVVGFRDRNPKHIVGIQCKLKTGKSKLTKTEAAQEIKKALGYKPRISEYFIVATSKDDTKLLQYAQQRTQELSVAGRTIHIHIWGWDTLQEKINQSEAAKKAFDPGFSPSVASQDRKLDALLEGQKRQPTKKQLADLAKTLKAGSSGDAAKLPKLYADRELKSALDRAMRRRGFGKANTAEEFAALAERALAGDLSLGESTLRAEICDRAARANAVPASKKKAKQFRDAASTLDSSRDLFIANALLKEAHGDLDGALRALRSRTDPDTRSALLTTIIRVRGSAAALDWARTEKLGPSDLNPPGAMNLILQEIDQGEFDGALAHVLSIPPGYEQLSPALRLLRAQLVVASILPGDQKAALFQGLPMDPRILQLAGGAKALEAIRLAAIDLRTLMTVTRELGLGELHAFLTEFDLWLRLEDDTTREAARDQVAREVAEPQTTLQRVRLALSYNIPFNQEALQRHLTTQKEIGGWTPDERFAAFLLAFHSDDPKKIAEFFDKHHDEMFSQKDLVHSALAGIEIEVLAHTGRFEDARKHIAIHTGKHLTPEQATYIEEMVAHIQKGDEAEAFRQRYLESKNVADLRLLVTSLRARRDTKQLATYAPLLAREIKTRDVFDVAVKALFRDGKLADVLRLMEDLPELFVLDHEYASIRGWTLFRLGRIMEARAIARSLMSKRCATSDRELVINTAIETGDWGNLQALLAQEAARADDMPANDLIRLARLSLEVNSPYVDHFRDAALRKEPNDPHVNLSAYMLATERGEEYQGSQAHLWFQNAIKHSGPDGPVRSASMKEIIDQLPGWNERADNVDRMLRQAEAPLFIAAGAVRRQLIDLIWGQAQRNADLNDSRLAYPVFAFFGAHPWQPLNQSAAIALDISCIFTLDYLGLLQTVLDYFERIIIAPSTLSMLFFERQFLRVHQPSEVAKAERVRALLSAGGLKIAPDTADASPADTKEFGRDLADLISLARRDGGVVIRSAPVSKLGTYLDEQADMSGHAAILTDTLSALNFLAAHGKIDTEIKQAAETYLRQVDKGWEVSPAITPDSKVFLDDLTVVYLDHVGILDILTRSVAAVYVHPDVEARARQTLNYGKQANDLLSTIDRIRTILNGSIEAGRISFSARRLADSEDEQEDDKKPAPTLDIMNDLTGVDIIIADDRCLNKLATWSDNLGHSAKTATSLEILDELANAKKLTQDGVSRARHKLRAAGYYAMPVRVDEIVRHVTNAPVQDQTIRETPELRAIRESIAIARISNAFLPSETPWLNSLRFEIIKSIRAVWTNSIADDATGARADWLLSILPNPLEWCLEPENDTVWAAARQQAIGQAGLLLIFAEGTLEQKRRYFTWLNGAFIKPFEQKRPELWREVVPFLKPYVMRLLGTDDAA